MTDEQRATLRTEMEATQGYLSRMMALVERWVDRAESRAAMAQAEAGTLHAEICALRSQITEAVDMLRRVC